MGSFHICLSAAKNLSSFQLLPTSLVTVLLQLFLGLPIFRLPWGFHSRGAFGISPSSRLNVWPIHLNFLFLISRFISSWPVTLHKSVLEIMLLAPKGSSVRNFNSVVLWTYQQMNLRVFVTSRDVWNLRQNCLCRSEDVRVCLTLVAQE